MRAELLQILYNASKPVTIQEDSAYNYTYCHCYCIVVVQSRFMVISIIQSRFMVICIIQSRFMVIAIMKWVVFPGNARKMQSSMNFTRSLHFKGIQCGFVYNSDWKWHCFHKVLFSCLFISVLSQQEITSCKNKMFTVICVIKCSIPTSERCTLQ